MGGAVEAGDELVQRERPARLAARDGGLVVGRQRGEQGGRRQPRAAREGAAELLGDRRLLEEAEPGAAMVLGDRDARPAELGELLPGGLGVRVEELAHRAAELLLLGAESGVHQAASARKRSIRFVTFWR
jgi:hypothetical protein